MNKKQKIAALIGTMVIIVMTIYPPWYAYQQLTYESALKIGKHFNMDSNEVSPYLFPAYSERIKYSFIWKRPWSVIWDEPHERTGATSSQYRIDFSLLFMQWAIVAVVLGRYIGYLQNKKPRDEQNKK